MAAVSPDPEDDTSPLDVANDVRSARCVSISSDGGAENAKMIAREKFEWLTSHAVVTQRRPTGERSSTSGNGSETMTKKQSPYHFSSASTSNYEDESPCTLGGDGPMGSPGSYVAAAKYLSSCARYSLTPNGGALLGLSLGLELLEVDGVLTNLELVPLCAALLDAPFIKHLKLSGHPLQDTGAAVLALALPGCLWITEVELVGCRLTGAGVMQICKAITRSSVKRLVLRNNFLRQNAAQGNKALADAVELSPHLTSLDLQSCGLASQGLRMIKAAQTARSRMGYDPCTVDFEGNFVLVEVLNSVTHGACALCCLEAWRRIDILVVKLCHFASRLSVTLYVVSMFMMFLGSTLYHSMFAVTDLAWFFKVIDHCAIYFLIAGTYTPVLVMGCRDPQSLQVEQGVHVWVIIYWLVVLFGIIMEHVFSPRTPSWYSKFVLSMYVALGFGGVPYVASCPLVQGSNVMVWIELGGLTYVVGIVFFLLDKRYPAMHVIWHLMVAAAAFFHFVGVWNLVHDVVAHHKTCTNISWGPNSLGAFMGSDDDITRDSNASYS
eukprot:TRINITY_DN37008_c0_g1_i1.p1 TRINITY_DN37008_c0_g1~~TRINITY_DN37008_c0_g1_i1.p1  ORF type:complete len:593 (-),score=81.57 TRINITY_DN37008_c0_g1_i1:97-1749(-)